MNLRRTLPQGCAQQQAHNLCPSAGCLASRHAQRSASVCHRCLTQWQQQQCRAEQRESRGERNKVKSDNSSRACTTAVRAKAVRQVCNGGSTIRRCSTLGPTAAGHYTLLAALLQRYHSCSNTGKTSKNSSVVKVAAEAVFWRRRLKITAQ